MFALAAFAVAVFAGIGASNPASVVLLRGIIALVVCYPVGAALGSVGRLIVREHAKHLTESRPVPDYDAVVAKFSPQGEPRRERA